MKRVLACLLFLSPVAALAVELPTEHKVVLKDTLWDLAGHYYHDPFKWRRIAEANPPPKLNDPHWIYPDQIIKIPALEAGAPAAPEPAPAPAAEAPRPAAPAAPKAPARRPRRTAPRPDEAATPEGLSTEIPEGIVSGHPFVSRFKAAPGWKADGVTLPDPRDGDHLSGQEDMVLLRVDSKGAVNAGDRFSVFRPSAPTDMDPDQKADYYVRIGVVEVRRREGKQYEAVIVEVNDAVQAGDLVKRGE